MSESHPRDFVLYLNSADQGTHPLEPGVTTVRAAFRQELERPLTLSEDWKVALLSLVYTHSYGNAVLKSPQDFHYDVKICLKWVPLYGPYNCLLTNTLPM